MKQRGESQFFEGDPRSIAPEFGTKPVPAGMVRFHHYTGSPESARSIQQHGLLRSYGEESFARRTTESPDVFATAGAPSEDFKRSQVFVEGFADPKRGGQLDIGENYLDRDPMEHVAHMEARRSTITARGDIPASQIIGVHEPWHEAARYMAREGIGSREAAPGQDPYAMGSVRSQVQRGEHDWMEHDTGPTGRVYGPAIKATKITNAATVMLGGKL